MEIKKNEHNDLNIINIEAIEIFNEIPNTYTYLEITYKYEKPYCFIYFNKNRSYLALSNISFKTSKYDNFNDFKCYDIFLNKKKIETNVTDVLLLNYQNILEIKNEIIILCNDLKYWEYFIHILVYPIENNYNEDYHLIENLKIFK